MTANHSLLSYIARYHTDRPEDVATDALSFILRNSGAARQAFSEFVGDQVSGPLPIEDVTTRVVTGSGVVPDLVCRDACGNVVAVIESKFWADLTSNQPVSYWAELPVDSPSALLVVVPEARKDYLWNQLVSRLETAGNELDFDQTPDQLVTASARAGQRRLMLTTWNVLLDRIAQQVWADRDWQASFEIEQLQKLADNTIARNDPRSDAALKELIANALRHLGQSGWANTTGLGVGQLANFYYGRYLRLSGNFAWLGIEYRAWQQMPDKPLWLLFFHREYNRLDNSELGSRLEGSTSRLDWRANTVCVPIELPTGADTQATLRAVVASLEDIGRRLDPDGPTYWEQSNA